MRRKGITPLGWMLGLLVVLVGLAVSILSSPAAWWVYWLFAGLTLVALMSGNAITHRRMRD